MSYFSNYLEEKFVGYHIQEYLSFTIISNIYSSVYTQEINLSDNDNNFNRIYLSNNKERAIHVKNPGLRF